SIDEELNVCTPDDTKAVLKRYVIKNTPVSVLIVDSSKFSHKAIHRAFNLREIDFIVTDYTGSLERE
ncbi:MAG: DeoR/GlpR transcriptional regulator, partial [Firmicutes bacterium]|nr:DeoR/GlpR transcriptional regulator [Bacillota bacterium]